MNDFLRGRLPIEELPDGMVILPGALKVMKGSIPVYLSDRTEIGTADVVETAEGVYAMVRITEPVFAEFMKDEMIGLCTISIAGHPGTLNDQIKEKKEEEQ